MPSPTQASTGALCLKVKLQGQLSIGTTETDGSKTATDVYVIQWSARATQVDCEGASDGTNTVPVWGAQHPVDPNRLVRRINTKTLAESRHVYQSSIEYADDQTTPSNPLMAAPIIEWDVGANEKLAYFLDNDPGGQKPVLNSASDRFADFLQRDSGTVSATYTINLPLTGTAGGYGGRTLTPYNAAQAVLYCASGTQQSSPAMNSDSFTFGGFTFAPYQARTKSYTNSAPQIQNGVKYTTAKWTLLFKNTWLDIVDDRGFNYLTSTPAGDQLAPILKGGTPDKCDFPWPLNGSGSPKPNVTDTPPKLTFYPYPQRSFSALNF